MSSQIAPETVGPERFSRRVANRFYPCFARQFSPDRTEGVANDLCRQIEDCIRKRVSFARQPGSYRDHRPLLDDYTRSIQVVRQVTAEIRTIVESLWRLNTHFHCMDMVNVKARDEFLADHFKGLSEQVNLSLKPPSSVLSAALEAMPVGFAEIELRDKLDNGISQFALQVCDLFDHMSDLDLVGLVDWKASTACDAFFYRDVIIQEELGRLTVKGERQVLAVHDRGLIQVHEIAQDVSHITKGQHTVRHALYELYLSDAKANRVLEFADVIPADIKQFLTSLPEWFCELVRIIEGTKRSERIIAQDVRVEEWEDTKVVTLYEKEAILFCPLVTLGNYVLTGWGDAEKAAEISRQRKGSLFVLAVLLQCLGMGLLGLGQLLSPVFGYLAAISVVGGLGCFVEGVRQRWISKRQIIGLLPLGLAGLWGALLSFSLLSLTVGIVSSVPLLSVMGVCCVVATILWYCTGTPLTARHARIP